jgi:Arc/MetJ-type ribon-helix-helix transcriptional regulator
MNLEIHKPELVQRVNAHIQTGKFHDAEEVLEKALEALEEEDALEEKAPVPMSPRERRRAVGRKSLVELFAPLQGLNLDFSRNKSTGQPVDLS